MKIVKSLVEELEVEGKKYEYSYRIIETNLNKFIVFGIEVERVDYINGKMVNIEREVIDKISEDLIKVEQLYKLVSENLVSPIHLIDILGEYADNYIAQMKEERAIVYN
ncbi:MAG: DUF6514 family protein [Sarcina sp.]